jgi:hypothetical protein
MGVLECRRDPDRPDVGRPEERLRQRKGEQVMVVMAPRRGLRRGAEPRTADLCEGRSPDPGVSGPLCAKVAAAARRHRPPRRLRLHLV